MSSIDKLKLLAGVPITMSDFTCSVHPATLKEIATLGIAKYFKYVNLLTLDVADIRPLTEENIDPFEFLCISATYREDFKEELLKSLDLFIKEEVQFIPDLQSFIIGDFQEGRILTKDNFFEFQQIIKAQNFIQEEVVKFTGEDEAAKMIRAKLEKANRALEKAKLEKEENKIEMSDLVSSLSINSSLNIYIIWEISYYAFNDQFKRMRILEQYNTGLQSIMAGADPKKIKLKDWIQSIQ